MYKKYVIPSYERKKDFRFKVLYITRIYYRIMHKKTMNGLLFILYLGFCKYRLIKINRDIVKTRQLKTRQKIKQRQDK